MSLVRSDRPVAFWLLNEPEGATTAHDATGHGHDGTYIGFRTEATDT